MPEPALIPPGRRSQFVATVSSNVSLCREHHLLSLIIPQGFPPTEPGQFVQLQCRDLTDPDISNAADHDVHWADDRTASMRMSVGDTDLLAPTALLRRPFSLAGRRDLPDGSTELEIIHRVVGVGTDWLAHRRPADRVGVLGPLGNRFLLPEPGGSAVLIGGGVGIPPMLYLAEALAAANVRTIAFCGAVSRDLLALTIIDHQRGGEPSLNIAEFARHGIRSVITTDDGSYGLSGFVTQALERHLDASHVVAPPRPVLYTCGPEPMMKRVAEIAAARGLEAQIAVERAMACGMGTCQSCCIRARTPGLGSGVSGLGHADNWVYKLACTDGPIFRADELLW